MTSFLSRYQPAMLAILRIMAALLFLEHGLMKLFQFPVSEPTATYPLPTLMIVAALIEAIGGGLLALGLFTRLAAFISSGEMAAGYFITHAKQGFWPGANGGDAAVLFCFLFLYFVFSGAGPYSLDALRARRGAVE